MKRIYFLIIVINIFFYYEAKSQRYEDNTIAKIYVSFANLNGMDSSQNYKDKKVFFSLYTKYNRDTLLALVWPTINKQIFGRIIRTGAKKITNTNEGIKFVSTYKWIYFDEIKLLHGEKNIQLEIETFKELTTFKLIEIGHFKNSYCGLIQLLPGIEDFF